MKKDIETRADIELLVTSFYEKVIADEQIGPIFEEIAKVNWSTHLPAMYDFWENILLFTGTYEGNPINIHKHLQHSIPLQECHFNVWNKLFISTIDELFEGKNANLAKVRAISRSGIIKEKVKACCEDDPTIIIAYL